LPDGCGSDTITTVATRHEVAPMPTPGLVTAWIEQLKAGDAAAAAPLWQGYFRRLVGLARQSLGQRRATSPPSANLIAGWLLSEAAVLSA
jgi:hypothetical protein